MRGLPIVAPAAPVLHASSPDVTVLRAADDGLAQGRRVWLVTVLHTYGSAPRPVGAMAAIDDRGHVTGSVSGGCVEDDLVDSLRQDALDCERPQVVRYGGNADERARLRLPCNGHIDVWLEPLTRATLQPLLYRLETGQAVVRTIDLATGASRLGDASPSGRSARQGSCFEHHLGPAFRLVMVGAGDVSRYLAPIALSLGFAVDVVDPRDEYLASWPVAGCGLSAWMPDDHLAAAAPDERTAVVALSHDPKLDDLALLEALPRPLMYVGAMGASRTTAALRARLVSLGITEAQADRLRRPVGVAIGARTAPEIAVAIAADLVDTIRRAAASG